MPRSSLFKKLTTVLLAGAAVPALAQWENLNPGAGGQIQSVDLDPNIPGRAFYSSDMEGAYRTDDYGASWQLINYDAGENNTLVIRAVPGDSNHLYMGQLHGLEVSRDGGRNWKRAAEVKEGIMFFSINPAQTDEVIAAPGARFRWRQRPNHPDPVGELGIYRTTDGGESWEFVSFGLKNDRKDVFTVYHNPGEPNRVIAGALRGVYASEDSGASWKAIDPPAGTGECWGACWSPDGKVLFATYRVAGENSPLTTTEGGRSPATGLSHLFAKRAGHEWVNLSAQSPSFDAGSKGNNNYWMPEVDSKVAGPELYRVGIAPVNNREGLSVVDVHFPAGAEPKADWQRVFFHDHPSRVAYDTGWEHYSTRSLSWEFTPSTWPETGIWTTGDQTLFRGQLSNDPDKKRDKYNTAYDWQNVYTRYVQTIDGVRFYRTRGAQCTFIFDGEAYKHYTAQANGDNAVKESYDHGQSWAVGLRLPRSNAIQILRDLEPPLVLAHTSSGYGGSSDRGALWAKRLVHLSPKDSWQKVGGDREGLGGLPDKLYNQIIQDPHQSGRVYLGTRRAHTWLIEDIESFIAGTSQAVNISAGCEGPLTINDKGVGMSVDPHDGNVLWAIGTTDAEPETGADLFRGVRTGDTWQWEIVRSSETHNTQIAVWDHYGKTGLALIRVDPQGHHYLEMSLDGGESWQRGLDLAGVEALRTRPVWLEKYPSELLIKGLTANGPRLALAYASEWSQAKGYGIFMAALDEDGTAHWRDVTGDNPFPYPVKQRFINVDGKDWLYTASKGAGWWRRPLE